MAVSKAQQKAVTKYVKTKYDRFGLTMPKGNLDIIKDHAAAVGESVNGYINAAIEARMKEEGPEQPAGGGGIQLSPDTLRAAQEAAEAAGEDVATFIARAVKAQAERDRSAVVAAQK